MTVHSRRRAIPVRDLRGPARSALRGRRPMAVQALLITAAALAYFGVRNLTQGDRLVAEADARRVLSLERALHIDWEGGIQDVVIRHNGLVDLANWIYIYGHWPLIGITLVGLFLRAPAEYRNLRNAMFVSGGIGLVVFTVFPVAPPRLLDLGLVDTVTQRSDSYRTLQPQGLINRYAALPSLHFGWDLLVGVVIWRATDRRTLRAAALVMPMAMAFAVIVTANHYVLDVVVGGAVAMIGLACALVIARATWERERATA